MTGAPDSEALASALADVTRAVVAEAGSAHGADRIHLDMHGDTRLQGDLDRLGQVAAGSVSSTRLQDGPNVLLLCVKTIV